MNTHFLNTYRTTKELISVSLAPTLRLLSACVRCYPTSQMRQSLNEWAWQVAEKDMSAIRVGTTTEGLLEEGRAELVLGG